MGFLQLLTTASIALFAGASAFPSGLKDISSFLGRRQNSSATCTNSATSRSCWTDGYDINTNWYEDTPLTGNVREYWLEVTNSTMAPDGFSKTVLVFNNTYPGPTIEADWGDTLRIHVTNKLSENGTSVHWHGIRQLGTNEMDGVNGITQCPLAPGDTMTYEFNATQYGTTWYHSHFSLQYGEGTLGPMIINGPASADYDVDLGPFIVQDWYHHTIYSLWSLVQTTGPVTAQGGLVNGTGVWDCTDTDGDACTGGTSYGVTTIESGKKYRLRFINTSIETVLALELDGHNMTVIAADLVPIQPFSTKYLTISMGQRYDVIIEADQAVDNYWFRAYVQSCSTTNASPLNIKSIFRYEGASTSDPTTEDDMTSYSNACSDMALSKLQPVVEVTPDSSAFSASEIAPVDVELVVNATSGIFSWAINDVGIHVDWADPILLQQQRGDSYLTTTNTMTLNQVNEWVYFVITDVSGAYHPIHLHGHDFSLLKQAALSDPTDATSYDLSDVNFSNTMRRDVAILPGNGYIVIGFETDNPGSWIMHCHIAWHISGGLGMNFMERPDEIFATKNLPAEWNSTCANWSAYDPDDVGGEAWLQEDSGLKVKRQLRGL